ncbi:hypothetical protein AS9A_2834 [Hoyosella subflava DQS3-9A1]|uniref:Uncharacterized protein n=1 Tax=Hoyosella subflava (strain DSM 45089 / JCM 17490 / NBRC 109087 / DQS3-9A1) TaxID=443218 RepID=F6EJ49_HOYSD|nr:hypothetical protein AS9A_2834 [Hoyosella subflava DQS3-9A1]
MCFTGGIVLNTNSDTFDAGNMKQVKVHLRSQARQDVLADPSAG